MRDDARELLQYKMDKKLGASKVCSPAMSESNCTTNASSDQTGSERIDSTSQDPQSPDSKPQYPQHWRVVSHGGAMVRSASSLTSKKLGIVRQNEQLVVISAKGRQLKVINPDFNWATGWVSESTEEGLVIMEQIKTLDHNHGASRTQHRAAQNAQERCVQATQSFMDRLYG